MNAREIGLTQVDAAAIAEFSERTGQRIEAGEHQPNRGRVRDAYSHNFGTLFSPTSAPYS
ncbi:MAG: hypothetical protein ACKO24_12165 [Leptolyngbyaceae cyanobacterium]